MIMTMIVNGSIGSSYSCCAMFQLTYSTEHKIVVVQANAYLVIDRKP